MSNKQFAITSFAIGFGVMSFIYAVMFMAIAKDLKEQLDMRYQEYCLMSREVE